MIRALPVSALIGVLAIAAFGEEPQRKEIVGYARIVDGDTIVVQNQPVRLFGVDAPEFEQICADDRNRAYRCGLVAADALDQIIGNHVVVCLTSSHDGYGRAVATCFVGTEDIGAAMVSTGYAVDYPAYSHGKYRQQEDEARAAKRGLWIGRFDKPWDWRREHR